MIRLADVFRQFLADYDALHTRSPQAYKVCQQIEACRTPALGGFQLHCANCDEDGFLYHACRNRHCPRCQHEASEAWEQARLADVVDAPYFHLVFTLPHELNHWARLHPSAIYHTLFQSVWGTVNTLGQDKKHLSGQLGMTAVLHTWGQNLSQHIHLYCLIPGGALSTSGEWHPAKSNYLFPVKVLSRLFRGKMVTALRACYGKGSLPRLTDSRSCDNTLDQLMNKEWVVYARHCLSKPEIDGLSDDTCGLNAVILWFYSSLATLNGRAEKSNPLIERVPMSRFSPTRDLYHARGTREGFRVAENAVFFLTGE